MKAHVHLGVKLPKCGKQFALSHFSWLHSSFLVLQSHFMSETSTACATTCAAGELDVALMQWPKYFNLLCPTV